MTPPGATMTAVRLTSWGASPELVRVPVPTPGHGELLLRVTAAGLCHSDLHVAEAAAGDLPFSLPFTLGHEVAGTVVQIGPGVAEGWLDVDVAVYGVWSCGACRRCLARRDSDCLQLTRAVGCGLGYDGGLAEFLLVPSERYLVPARGVPPELLAPLTDAGLTAYHAVRSNLDALDEGGAVVVVGVGGLGHIAVQSLRAVSATHVVAVDPREGARILAAHCGAALTFSDLGEVHASLEPFSGADLVLDFVGSSTTIAGAAELLAPGGRLVVVGSAGGTLVAEKGTGMARGWQVAAPFWGPRSDLEAVIDLAVSGDLRAEVETFTLQEVPEAYERLRRGEIRGRAVVVPHRAAFCGTTPAPTGRNRHLS